MSSRDCLDRIMSMALSRPPCTRAISVSDTIFCLEKKVCHGDDTQPKPATVVVSFVIHSVSWKALTKYCHDGHSDKANSPKTFLAPASNTSLRQPLPDWYPEHPCPNAPYSSHQRDHPFPSPLRNSRLPYYRVYLLKRYHHHKH